MTDISIIGTGCLILALVIAAGIVTYQRYLIRAFKQRLAIKNYVLADYRAAEAKRQAQRIAAGKKGRATQTARALAKKAGL